MTLATDATAALPALCDVLRKWQQLHVLSHLERSSPSSPLEQQLLHFETWYPGGLESYLRTATQLYRDQQRGDLGDLATPPSDSTIDVTGSTTAAPAKDPFASWKPSIPVDSYGLLDLETPKFRELEALGLQNAQHCAFVVVAGGLGERLGYNGIKLALPVETVTKTSYIQVYIQHIQALEHETECIYGGSRVTIPLAIMTSDATHDATLDFLQRHDFFGLPASQITLLKQDTVPCLDAVATNTKCPLQLVLDDSNNDANDGPKSNTRRLVMKPHGHGDVHTLLYTSGLARAWLESQHKRYVHFIQDTNALILNSTLPLLGASVAQNWKWSFTVVPRKAKDASGAIVQFTKSSRDDHYEHALFNVEYHELDHFLRTQAGDAFHDGDANDPRTGFSSFPGNINHFVADLASYVDVLEESRGKTPEIFNPKYRSGSSALFKSPARLECMMQDFPRLLVSSSSLSSTTSSREIGFLSFPSSLVYSPCKNDTASAAAKVVSDIPPQCACSAEHDVFALNKAKLTALGVQLTSQAETHVTGARETWLGIPIAANAKGPHVTFCASFGVSLSALQRRFPTPSHVSISHRSTLIFQGAGAHGVTIRSLELDGALEITACEGVTVDVQGLSVTNDGYEYVAVDPAVAEDAVDRMRGYILTPREVLKLTFDRPGRYAVQRDGTVVTL